MTERGIAVENFLSARLYRLHYLESCRNRHRSSARVVYIYPTYPNLFLNTRAPLRWSFLHRFLYSPQPPASLVLVECKKGDLGPSSNPLKWDQERSNTDERRERRRRSDTLQQLVHKKDLPLRERLLLADADGISISGHTQRSCDGSPGVERTLQSS